MIYFKEDKKNKLINSNNKSLKLFVVFSIVFVLLTILFLLIRNIIYKNISLIVLIIISTIYFSYLLCFIQQYMHQKHIINLYNEINKNEKIIEVVIDKILDTITINRLLFVKVIVKNEHFTKQLYLYEPFKNNIKENDTKTLIISGNYIKGEN